MVDEDIEWMEKKSIRGRRKSWEIEVFYSYVCPETGNVDPKIQKMSWSSLLMNEFANP